MPLLRDAAGKPITLAEEIGIGSIVLAGDRRRRPAPRRGATPWGLAKAADTRPSAIRRLSASSPISIGFPALAAVTAMLSNFLTSVPWQFLPSR